MLMMNLFKPESGIHDSTDVLLGPDSLTGRTQRIVARRAAGDADPGKSLDELVTALQIARKSLSEAGEELETALLKLNRGRISAQDGQRLLDFTVSRARWTLRKAKYRSRHLLDGETAVKIYSFKGKALVASAVGFAEESEFEGLSFELLQKPAPRKLTGNEPLTEELLANESKLAFREGEKKLSFRVRGFAGVREFLEELNGALRKAGFGFRAEIENGGAMFLLHRLSGDAPPFSASSKNTRLLSDAPGEFKNSDAGRDLKVRLADLELTSPDFSLRRLDSPSGRPIRLDLNPNLIEGKAYPVRADGEGFGPGGGFSFPRAEPATLGRGVFNRSGFANLDEVLIENEDNLRDARLVLEKSLGDLSDLADTVSEKIESYSQRSLAKRGIAPGYSRIRDEDFISFDKAERMVSELNRIIFRVQDQTHI